MSASASAAMERCKQYFAARNAAHLIDRVQEFTESSATVELAAQRLKCEPAHIAKSLSYLQKKVMSKAEAKLHQRRVLEMRKQQQQQQESGADDASPSPAGSPTGESGPGAAPADANVVIIVVAGDAKVNPKKYKEKFACQPKMLRWEEVEPYTGFPPGGVCPFALSEAVKVYLDVSMKRFPHIYPAVGTTNTGIQMTPEELEQYASNLVEWVDLCEGWQPRGEDESSAPPAEAGTADP